jgi:DNA gyrase subunit A
VKGPDFPTGGFIYGRAGIKDYQVTGRGKIVMRARAVIEEKESTGRSQIVVTEVPYQVNRAELVKSISELVREKSWKASATCATSRATRRASSSSSSATRFRAWC